MQSEAFKTLRLGFPIIIGELAQMVIHLIDTAMVGAISYKHIAAASLVINVINIPLVLGFGMTISVSQMVSMAHGRNDSNAISHYLFNGFFICTLTAFLISGALVAGSSLLTHLGQDAEVVQLALPFMRLMAWSIIPMLLFITLKQFADGLQITQVAMILSLLAIPVDVFLNWLLIYGNWGFPRLELIGAGWAALITRLLLFFIFTLVVFTHRHFKEYMALIKGQWYLKRRTLNDLLHIGIPSSLQVAFESGAFAVSAIIIGTIGAVAQAAHQIAISCASFTFMVSMGLSQAGSIRVSNAYGRNDWSKIATIGKSSLQLGWIYGSFCALCFGIFRNQLPLIFNNNPQVVQLSSILLICAAIFQISDSTQAISAGLLRGIKDVKLPTILIAVAYWLIGLPLGYLLAVTFKLRTVGMWVGFIAGLTFAGIFLSVRFLKRSKQPQQSRFS
jgi:MATE family multidrug resistance protein